MPGSGVSNSNERHANFPVNDHVLLVTPGFPAGESDTTCIPPLQVMLERVAGSRRDLEVSVISLHYPEIRQPYRWHGFEVIPLGAGNRRWPLRLADLARGVAAAQRLHSRRPVNMVHALWLTDAALLAWRIARRLHLPLAATVMGQDALPSNRYLRWLPLSRMRVAAVSERAADALRLSSGKKVDAIIPWGLNAPRAEPSAEWSGRTIDLLGVGSLTKNKDFILLLRLCHQLLEAGRPIRAVLIGNGLERDSLEAEAARMGLGSNLVFEGHRPRPEVLQRMAGARILLHPAHYEGFGFVFSEALACGMSVVSRPVGAATPGQRWRLCLGEEEFLEGCTELLDHPPDTGPLELWSEDSTVQAYGELLGLGGCGA